jgi:hypothetical protein
MYLVYNTVVSFFAEIWWELVPHYFPGNCFGGGSDLAGTGSTLFFGGLFLVSGIT